MMIRVTSKSGPSNSLGDCLKSIGVVVNDLDKNGKLCSYYNLPPNVWIYEDADKNIFICGIPELPIAKDIIGTYSDGFHTYNELYEFRKLYNAALFNVLADRNDCEIVKSYRHSDGELCFGGGWFIVTATLPTGQVSNHYKNEDWDLFHCKEVEMAPVWDGHTATDVLTRLKDFINVT